MVRFSGAASLEADEAISERPNSVQCGSSSGKMAGRAGHSLVRTKKKNSPEDGYLLGCCTVQCVRTIELVMEAAGISETSVNFHQTSRLNNLKNSRVHTRRLEDLKSHKILTHGMVCS
jgi:hypothetical protein